MQSSTSLEAFLPTTGIGLVLSAILRSIIRVISFGSPTFQLLICNVMEAS